VDPWKSCSRGRPNHVPSSRSKMDVYETSNLDIQRTYPKWTCTGRLWTSNKLKKYYCKHGYFNVLIDSSKWVHISLNWEE